MGNSSSAASLPYTIGAPQTPSPNRLGWHLHSGHRKSDSTPVTVFKLSKTTLISPKNGVPQIPNGEVLLHTALHHFKKSKTLIHPQILRVEATLDTDDPEGTNPTASASGSGDLIIVTEPVIPLLTYLNGMEASSTSQPSLAWGLHNLIHALSFLHNNAKLSHSNLSLDSVYVTPGGDFKLGDFSLLTALPLSQHFRECDIPAVCPPPFRSPERQSGDYDEISDCAPHVLDSYALGVFLEELFEHPSAGGRIPTKLVKAVARLKTPNMKMRPRVLPLLRCPIFDVPLVKFNEALEGAAAKAVEEKIMFYHTVPDLLQKGTVDVRTVGRYKLLPELVRSVEGICAGAGSGSLSQDVNRREIMAVIPPLFLIVEYMTSSEEQEDKEFFQKHIIPLLTTMFTINDRGVRGALLSRLPALTAHIPATTLNNQIFEPMCSGFSDTSAPLRELTLKSTISLVPHLNSTSLEKLTRYLIRLQGDAEASIRTNTIIFVGKIVETLGVNQRQKLILPAFTRAMKDEFTPCRLAALKAVLQCKDYFEPNSLAKDVLPLVCPHLMDKVADVRVEAMRVVDEFVFLLKEECERMSANEDNTPRQDTATTSQSGTNSSIPAAPSSGGWAMSGLGSWAMGGIMSSTKGADAGDAPPATGGDVAVNSVSHTTAPPPPADDNDGWSDEEDGDMDTGSGGGVTAPSWVDDSPATSRKAPGLPSEDDFFSSFDKPAITTSSKIGGVGRVSGTATKGRLVVPGGGGGSSAANKKTLAERRAEFEKRKALRQQQLQAQKDGGKSS